MRTSLLIVILLNFGHVLTAQNIRNIKAVILRQELVVDQAPFASCHAATLVELPSGKLMAAWFGGPFESSPDVTIWMATHANGQWSQPKEVATGIVNDTLRYACWNPVLFRSEAGRLFLFYKVGASPRSWWGMMKYSDDEGEHWSAATKLPDGMLGPIKNKPLQLPGGTILHPSSTESADEKQWLIHIEKSDSAAQHWQKISIDCDTFGVIQPSILQYKDGRLQLLCRSRQNYIMQSWSTDKGNTWSRLTRTNLPNPNAGSDAVSLNNGLQLLVYNPMRAGKEWYNGRNKLSVAISKDGEKWKDILTLEDEPNGEFSYPAVIQSANGSIHILYTYDRKNIKHVVLTVQ